MHSVLQVGPPPRPTRQSRLSAVEVEMKVQAKGGDVGRVAAPAG
jgi:hypothetical protein